MNARTIRFVEWIVGALCVAAASAPAAPPLSMTGQDKAILRGRFVRSDGAPAGGVRLELKESAAVESALATATSGADGAFSMEFAASKTWSTLEARREGSGTLQWHYETRDPGSVVDLGVVRLPPGWALEGIVLDESGAAALGEWEAEGP